MANVLAVGAHADDIELGCGGVMAQHVAAGDNVYFAILTDGGGAGSVKERRREEEAAAAKVGASIINLVKFPDGELSLLKEAVLIDVLRAAIEHTAARTVYLHHHIDLHSDHAALGRAGKVAARHLKRVLMYETPSTVDFAPTVYTRLTLEQMERKMDIIRLFKSQIERKSCGLYLPSWVDTTARWRGVSIREDYAEGFAPIRYIQ